ncbi:maleylacetoacetate isomerase [Tabrizicola oligotrophica]|uniref:Maleylacetoacetate isomerase n=1 Tax=Tabrizicola oligotrophica TaxID=2710650 RepID=A0A6M0QSQ2_9RHOB|nr:maleylacetoacetate isomerase [Tabrizicola oligotrophica]NEY89663.1 maleylacetoacetate isomerase [Tabrizicola oligotrophica]
MTKLHDYWRSSAAYRVRMALNLVGEPFALAPVDLLKAEQTGAENLARNPQGLVPTLEIDGLSLTQSLAIIEYLDETRQAGFLPDDPAGRARVRALSYAVAMEIHPVCNLRVGRFAESASGGAITMQAWQQKFISEGLAALEVMLDHAATGRFCHGDRVTMADLCLVPQVYNAQRWGVDVTSHSQIARIVAELQAIPAIAAAHPDKVKPQ